MKVFVIASLLFSLGGFAKSQTSPLNRPTADIDKQLSVIAAERSRLEAGFLSEDADCYQKFAVNRCLEGVNIRRMSAMSNLRMQEIEFNDEQRKSKGAEQIRKTEEKSSVESAQLEADNQKKAIEDFSGRQGREQENAQRRDAAVANEADARKANAARLVAREKKIQARTEKQTNEAEEAKKYKERQAQAKERLVQHEVERKNQVKPAAKPLPLPQ